MTTSPYSDHAANYLENGLSVIPCAPGTKFPGKYTQADGWRPAPHWQQYATRAPTQYEAPIWERWPEGGICLVLGPANAPAGLQLVAIDIDTDEPDEAAAIKRVLPGSPCIKRGAKGETQFYLAPESVRSKAYNDANERRMLDLLCGGAGTTRQTVLPPTIHPDTGQPYVWLTVDTLADYTIADLPVLAADIAEKLGEALKPFGFEERKNINPPEAGEVGTSSIVGIESPHRALNDAALANLAAWVPHLALYKCTQSGGKYKACATWRASSSGRPESKRAANLIISPEGIKDKGAEKGYTPLDLVMAACGTDLDTAYRWLQERVAPQPIVVLRAKAPRQEVPPHDPDTGEILTKGNLAGLSARPHSEQEIYVEADNEPTGIIPPDLCTPPGLIGDIVAWMNACSPVPSPQLNLSIALTFLGTIYGRRFEAPTGARTNFYAIGVADSGFGKSFPIKCTNSLIAAAGLERFAGPGGLKSDSALRKLLEKQNPVFVSMDEIGELFGKILARKAGSHEVGLRELLLALFSAADDVYRGSEGAAEKAVPIFNPHLCLSGMSTPSAFWGAFSTANAENGLLPRILIFDAGAKEPEEVEPSADRREVPQSICKALHAALDARPIGNIAAANPAAPVRPIMATYAPGAAEAYAAIRNEMKALRRSGIEGIEKLAYSRFAEHVIKLALCYAVSIEPTAPSITCAGLEWARGIVEHTTRALLAGAVDRVADNDFQSDYKKVLRMVKDAGPHGIGTAALTRAIAGSIDRRKLADILDQLRAAHSIEKYVGSGPKGGKPSERVRLIMDWAEAG